VTDVQEQLTGKAPTAMAASADTNTRAALSVVGKLSERTATSLKAPSGERPWSVSSTCSLNPSSLKASSLNASEDAQATRNTTMTALGANGASARTNSSASRVAVEGQLSWSCVLGYGAASTREQLTEGTGRSSRNTRASVQTYRKGSIMCVARTASMRRVVSAVAQSLMRRSPLLLTLDLAGAQAVARGGGVASLSKGQHIDLLSLVLKNQPRTNTSTLAGTEMGRGEWGEGGRRDENIGAEEEINKGRMEESQSGDKSLNISLERARLKYDEVCLSACLPDSCLSVSLDVCLFLSTSRFHPPFCVASGKSKQ